MKAKPLGAAPVAAALRVLAEMDVRHPRDIDIELIAARYGVLERRAESELRRRPREMIVLPC